jgi:hypothetical protein
MWKKSKLIMAAALGLALVLTTSSAVWPLQKQIPTRMANPKSGFSPSEDQQAAAFCAIYKDDGVAQWVLGSFDSGMAFSVYVDPGLCLREPPYPFQITDVHFDLVPWVNHDTWPVNVQFSIKQVPPGGKCSGPNPTSSLYSESFAFPEDSSYYNIPAFINYSLSQPFCVWEPFFLEIKYVSGILGADSLPSLSMDTEAAAADSCDNWAMIAGEYYRWPDFWSPPPPGDPIIRVTGYTEAEGCPDLWYWKPDKPTQAPSGMPDFDQNQDDWVGYCGPVAAANCLWWFGAVPEGWSPPQLIDTLARYFNTHAPNYTYVDSMQIGLKQYFEDYGFAYRESTFQMPDFFEMEDSLKKCQDIILLLGFWWYDESGQQWNRQGGHFVTMAGVCSESLKIAVSDPDKDAAEGGWPGRVRPVEHPPHPGDPLVHNNQSNVSQDMYQSTLESPDPSPGNPNWEINYQWSTGKFTGMNVPEEFIPYSKPAPEGAKDLYVTEVEYAVMICPTTSAVEDDQGGGSRPRFFELEQNYPNPFNNETIIEFNLQRPAEVTLTIFNVLGQRVRRLAQERISAGAHTIAWDGKDEKGSEVSSGVYFYQIKAGEQSQTKRLVFLK